MDVVRLIFALLIAVTVVFFLVRINDDWKRTSRGWRVTRLSMAGFIFVNGVGAIELMQVEPPVPLGGRIYFLFAFALGIVLGLWMVRKESDPNEGWIRAREVQSILDEVEAAHSEGCDPPAPGCVIARTRMRDSIRRARKETAKR